jgi:hypothetical protein
LASASKGPSNPIDGLAIEAEDTIRAKVERRRLETRKPIGEGAMAAMWKQVNAKQRTRSLYSTNTYSI